MQYELMDSGEGRKLERYGDFVLSRPDPQAIWLTSLDQSEWKKADATFDGKWKKSSDMPAEWVVEIGGLKLGVSLKGFKHTGVFPEHAENWKYLISQISYLKSQIQNPKILNLFGYTGGATLALAKAGAEVVHVDASKPSIDWAKANAKLNDLEGSPIRWILDDAKKFVEREAKRGVKYDGVVMDPPSFGRGAKGEIWKIETDLPALLQSVQKILQPDFKFLLLNGYASGFTPLAYGELLASVFNIELGKIERGELTIQERNSRAFSLPAGIFARYSR